jgi:SAM-dependent methyltransferase
MLTLKLIDLGASPPSNSYLTKVQLQSPELYYPLRVLICEMCWLVQTEDFASRKELFSGEYAYFSSYSSSWLKHSKGYVDTMVKRFRLDTNSLIVEVACNDGYLLQFAKDLRIPTLGIEPTQSTASHAREKGIETIEDFFGVNLAQSLIHKGYQADLMVANNVLAHVPDINDFVNGFSLLLKETGVATFEFPHLVNLIELNQFDTVYHEHFSYLSLTAVNRIFAANGLNIFDVEKLTTHGGSLRVFAQRSDSGNQIVMPKVKDLLEFEKILGIDNRHYYSSLQINANKIKNDFLSFLLESKRNGKSCVAYGAAAKGNTLLNYSGVKDDLVNYVVDLNPSKQNKYLPGSRIPIYGVERIAQTKPDYVILLPWNLKNELFDQLRYIGEWGGKIVTAVPNLLINDI